MLFFLAKENDGQIASTQCDRIAECSTPTWCNIMSWFYKIPSVELTLRISDFGHDRTSAGNFVLHGDNFDRKSAYVLALRGLVFIHTDHAGLLHNVHAILA
jgi:hypothetical protein